MVQHANHRLTKSSLGQVLDHIFPKDLVMPPFDARTQDVEILYSNTSTGMHNLLMHANNFPFRECMAWKYLIQIRLTQLDPARTLLYEELGRSVLGSVVPDRVHSGQIDLPEIGNCTFVVYALEQSENAVQCLSSVWEDMSSLQRKSVVEQVLECREKLAQIKFREDGDGDEDWPPSVLKLEHPTIKEEDTSKYASVWPRLEGSKNLWGVTFEAPTPHGGYPDFPSVLALLEFFLIGQGEVVRANCKTLVSPGNGAKYVSFGHNELRYLADIEGMVLQHNGLLPFNVLVTKTRRACNLPSKYSVVAIVGWHEARFASTGYDVALLDARLGYPVGEESIVTYYDKFRPEALKATLRAQKSPAGGNAILELLEAVHVFSNSEQRGRPPSASRDDFTPWSAHELWMREQHYAWSGAQKGFLRKLLRPS